MVSNPPTPRMRLGLSQRHLSRRGVELVRDSESGSCYCRFGQDPQPCMRKKLSRQQARCFLPITSRGLPAAAPSAASGDQPQRPGTLAGRGPRGPGPGARKPESKGRFQSFVCRPVPGRSLRAWRERPKLAGAQAASLASTVRTWRLSTYPDGSGRWQVLLPGLVPLAKDKGRGHSIGAYGDKTPWAERAARGEL